MDQHLAKPQFGSDVSLARRAGAYAIMSAIYAIPVLLGLVTFAVGGGLVAFLLAVLLVLAIFGIFVWQWRSLAVDGYTIGHHAFGYRIVDVNTGRPLGWGRAFARLLVVGVLATFTCGLGAIVLAVLIAHDPKKRGLHDQVAESIAVDVATLNDPTRPSLLDRVLPASGYAMQTQYGRRDRQEAATQPSVNEVEYRRMPPPNPHPGLASAGPVEMGAFTAESAEPELVVLRREAPADDLALMPEPEGVSQPSSPAQEQRWALEIADGEIVEIDGLSLLGRAPAAGHDERAAIVVIADPDRSVSKTHAAIGISADGRLWVEDRDSTHGVQVRGRDRQRMLMPGSRHTLNAGDIVILGLREIVVHLTGREGPRGASSP